MEWSGFTDDQLRELKSEPDPQTSSHPSRKPATESHGQRARAMNTRPRPQRGRGGRPPPGHNRPAESQPPLLQESQMLSKPKQQQEQRRGHQRATATETPRQDDGQSNHDGTKQPEPKESPAPESKTSAGRPAVEATPEKPKADKLIDNSVALGKELDEKEGLSRELSKLEEFQQQQKEIEDENQRKKNLLAIAIADRKKKTQAEVKRLAFIQKELSKIEVFLTTDVNILRDKIEEASRSYSEAQKRYNKAEEEFVAAKIHLHKTSELKEALTEHLCTIIRENELRKSRKLEELVEKLDVDNLASFEAELEAEAAKKAERQRKAASPSSSSPLASPSSENPKGTPSVSSTGDTPVSPKDKPPQEPTNPTSDTETTDSSSPLPNTTPEVEAKDPATTSSAPCQSSSTSSSGAVTQHQVEAQPSSTSHRTSTGEGEDIGKLEPNGQTATLNDDSGHQVQQA